MEVVEGVKLGDHVVHELSLLVVVAQRSELGQPDGAATASLVGSLEVGEQGVSILSLRVPVNSTEVNSAATLGIAGREEVLEPGNTHIAAAVGDSRGTDESTARVLVHVLLVHGSGLSGRHVGLVSVVRLVEAEKSLGATGESSLGVLVPVAESLLTPEHGDVADAGVQIRSAGTPVVGPAARLARRVEVVGESGAVVGHTTLGGHAVGRSWLGLGLGLGLRFRLGFRLGFRLRLRLRLWLGLRLGFGLRLRLRLRLRLTLDGVLDGSRVGGLGSNGGEQGGGGSGRRWGRSLARRRRRRGLRGRDNDDRGGGDDGEDRVDSRLGRDGLLALGDIDGLPNGFVDGLEGTLGDVVRVAVVVVGAGLFGESRNSGDGNDLGMHDDV